MFLGKDIQERAVEENCCHEAGKWLQGSRLQVWSEPGLWTLHRASNWSQSMGKDRLPSMLAARKKCKKLGPRASVICKPPQSVLGRMRTRGMHMATASMDPFLYLLSCSHLQLHWTAEELKICLLGKDVRQMFLSLEECRDSFKWGLWAWRQLSSGCERKAIKTKGNWK